ncbi:MAG: repair protein RecN [Fusobacteriaceae bacterium]|nr:repair protein RecN [Fusobacteriaceae bacterium]
MLKELRIENLAIIEKLYLEFESNLVVLTGETGAGKSIILDGINLLIGERATQEMIRDGAEKLLAEGIFQINDRQIEYLKELDIEVDDDEIIVQRIVERSGKGKAFVNGRRVPLNLLKNIMGTLVDLVGQHTHQALLEKEYHLKLLDRFLTDEEKKIKEKLEETVNRYNSLNKELKLLKEEEKNFREKKDLYEYQVNEINSLNLRLGEDEELEEEYKKLFNSGKIKENLEKSLMILREDEINALSIIGMAKRNLEYIAKYGKEYEEVLENLNKIYYELEDVVYYIGDQNDNIESNDFRLNEIVDRLDKINSLKKKYNMDLEEILNYKEEIEDKLSKIDYNSFELTKLENSILEVKKEYFEYAKQISEIRKKIAKNIEKMLLNEFKDLKMEMAKFKVFFYENDNISKDGIDDVEFMITTNVGQDYKPLSKIVSGGEISRIMLSLKSIFSKVDSIPILIFDEIDTGVGGETVRKVAEKLKNIGENVQVICITHSPNIAAKATQQFYIEKKIINESTVTTVKELKGKERLNEIARMLAGDNITDAVISHASELLKEGK